METTMYDQSSAQSVVKKMKSSMTLDFGSEKKSQNKTLLATPDLQILLSPELERLIVQQNGQVTTTPTPTQFLFPRSVTDEQEAYARGFVDALAELHEKKPPVNGSTNGEMIISSEIPSYTTLTTVGALPPLNEATNNMFHVQLPPGSGQQQILAAATAAGQKQAQHFTTLTPAPAASNFIQNLTSGDVPMDVVAPNVSVQMLQGQQQQQQQQQQVRTTQSPMMLINQRLHQLKEEPQTVPCMSDSPSPPMSMSNPVSPITPINMETQEVIKLDRKRARNRVAARKCRTRKLERISKLEDQVDRLKGENGKLTLTAKQLRDQVSTLKRQIMDHVNLGCKVMLSPNLL